MIYLILVVVLTLFSYSSIAKKDYSLLGYFLVLILALFAGLRHEVGAKPDWEVYHQVFYDAPEYISNLFIYFSDNNRLEKGYLTYNFIIHYFVFYCFGHISPPLIATEMASTEIEAEFQGASF